MSGSRITSALLACVVALALAATSFASVPPRPNIIVIMTDDVGYSEYGYTAAMNGLSTQIETPRIDALAQQSTIFTNGYTAAALCSPSRAGLLTGLYPSRFGWEDNISRGLNGEVDGLSAGQPTIASYLRDLGYSTAAMGKWHLGPKDNVNRPQDVGFDDFFGLLGGGRSFFRYPSGSAYDINILRGDTSVELSWPFEGDPLLYDPARGRYLTDALGEEAASYITQHAGSNQPFFLYVAFTATHTPLEYKQSDYQRFAHITDETQRQFAAMAYALDRAVGAIVDAVDANGLADNTVIVFTNDNGGPSVPLHSNAPFYGYKGGTFEGGIRVPFLMRVPGVQPGAFEGPVITLDLLPTFVQLAGGDASQIPTDGVNILPYLQGESSGDPHEVLFWRSHDGRFAVRKGDWKLMSPGASNPFARLHNLATHPNELVYFNAQQPAVLADLVRELTLWEAQMKKAQWGALGARTKNNFDHFAYRHEQGPSGTWSASGRWFQGGTTNAVQLTPEDAYANAILEFRTNDSGSYTSNNDMLRVTRYTFMLNEMRFTGTFAGATDHQATINGNALLMVRNLQGQLPRLHVEANQSVSPTFTFRVENELQLLDDLEITGDGTVPLIVGGSIRDYYQPRGVIKSGSSQVVLTGNNTFTGVLTVAAGQMRLEGSAAAIRGASRLVIGSDGVFAMANGLLSVPAIDNAAGGLFNFYGGTVQAVNVLGDLVNQGGTFSPGPSPALATIAGNFAQNAGRLEIEIGGRVLGSQFDSLAVQGAANLGGLLYVKLINGFLPEHGQSFPVLTAVGGLVGDFEQLALPAIPAGLHWSVLRTENSYSLFVAREGDYNLDGIVDAGDYVLWRQNYGQQVAVGTSADANHDGLVDHRDLTMWKNSFGASPRPDPTGDYNLNRIVDTADYVRWRRAFGQNVTPGSVADGNNDGRVDDLDYHMWKNTYGAVSAPPALLGDYNGDGRVDAGDLIIWRRFNNQSVPLGTVADGNRDGFVDQLDYLVWRVHYGAAPGTALAQTSSAMVPEPTCFALIAIAAYLTCATGRLRSLA